MSVEDKLWEAVAAVKAKSKCPAAYVCVGAPALTSLGSPAQVRWSNASPTSFPWTSWQTGCWRSVRARQWCTPLGAAAPHRQSHRRRVSINIGTLDEHWIKSFEACVELCKANDVPWVLDPVAAGFTTLRTETAVKLMKIHPPAVLRGNGSEITALNGAAGGGKGVDSTEGSDAAVGAAKELAAKFNCVVCVSGATDYIVAAGGEGPVMTCPHGHEMLTKVTACGKGAGALCYAFT